MCFGCTESLRFVQVIYTGLSSPEETCTVVVCLLLFLSLCVILFLWDAGGHLGADKEGIIYLCIY